jgi:membrane-bound lytic murein transglycosylase MltF
VAVIPGCSGKVGKEATEPEAEVVASTAPGTEDVAELEEPPLPPPPPPELMAGLNEPWTGDFDGMRERRVIRALVIYSPTSFFFDGRRPRGIMAELLQEFEKQLNETLETGSLKIYVIPIPVSADRLIPALEEGLGDLAASGLAITPGRLERVDASDPLYPGTRELVISGPGVQGPATIDDLSGREVWVRQESSYFESLEDLDERFQAEGRPGVEIQIADENLEDGDILEMTAAGIYPMTVVNEVIAEPWVGALDGLTVHDGVAVREDVDMAWMFRKNSPQLARVVNDFVAQNKKGTLLGNMLINRYLKSSKYVKNPQAEEDLERLRSMVSIFKQWAGEYNFDWLMMAAQGYQESGLDQSKVSHVGAIGVMQLMPDTAKDPAVGIPDIEVLERNIEAGNKYMRWILDNYFQDADLDRINKHLFAFASYNAGPNRIKRLRQQAAEEGFDPDIWFRNVEVVVAREVGREPVQYVSNIFKYYTAYNLVLADLEREKATASG